MPERGQSSFKSDDPYEHTPRLRIVGDNNWNKLGNEKVKTRPYRGREEGAPFSWKGSSGRETREAAGRSVLALRKGRGEEPAAGKEARPKRKKLVRYNPPAKKEKGEGGGGTNRCRKELQFGA